MIQYDKCIEEYNNKYHVGLGLCKKAYDHFSNDNEIDEFLQYVLELRETMNTYKFTFDNLIKCLLTIKCLYSMTQEDKQLLLKDLCARLPYGVIIQIPDLFFQAIKSMNDLN